MIRYYSIIKTASVFLLCVIASVFCLINSDTADGKELTVVYTGGTTGKLRSCNCLSDPYGGLAERVTLIRKLRKQENPFLLVDSGNMVSLFGDFNKKASVVVRLMNMMKYDAVASGGNEMYRGIKHAQAISREAKFPMISASIVDTTSHSLFFRPYVTAKIGGNSVAVIAVCDSACFVLKYSDKHDFSVLPLKKAIRSVLADISTECDFTIVLSQMTHDTNKALMEDFPKIDLIVEGYGNKRYDIPVKTRNGVIVSPGSRGQFVGLITIEKLQGNLSVKRSKLIPVLDFPEDDKAQKILRKYYSDKSKKKAKHLYL